MKKLGILLLLLLFVYWLPFLFISVNSHPQHKIENLPVSDAVIVFGTLVRFDPAKSHNISPLLKERLDASIAIYKAQKTKQIVVSNTKNAAIVMQQYLLQNGIIAKDIILDTTAEKTPDTCRHEKQIHPQQRKLIFVSQGYHLARINYQCRRLNVTATSFPAENIRNLRASTFSSFNIFFIRTKRYFREAGLTWLAFIGFYK